MEGGAWWAAVHEVAESRTRLSNFTFTFHLHALEKEMAAHSSVLAWRIPWTGEPGGLPSMGSHRVGHDWSDLAAAAAVPSAHSESAQKTGSHSRNIHLPPSGQVLYLPCQWLLESFFKTPRRLDKNEEGIALWPGCRRWGAKVVDSLLFSQVWQLNLCLCGGGG